MSWWVVLAWVAVLVGVVGFALGLRDSRRNDDVERGLVVWMALAWLGVAALVGTEIA